MLGRGRLAVVALGAAVSCATSRPARAQEVGASFLLLPASTRTLAMGGVGVVAEGPAALFDHVAGLARPGGSALLGIQRHLAGTRSATAAAGFGSEEWAAALGVHVLDYGDIQEIVPDLASGGELGVPTGARLSATDFALAAGGAGQLGRVRVGAAAKLVRQQVAEAGGHALAVDAGVRVPIGTATVAAGVQNLGGRLELSGSEALLPLVWRVGVLAPPIRVGATDVQLVAEMTDLRASRTAVAAGGEVAWRLSRGLSLAGRAGVRTRSGGDAGSRFSFGGALSSARVGLSYAYRGYGALGGVHRVGVDFGASH